MQVDAKTPNPGWHNPKFQSVFDSCEEAAVKLILCPRRWPLVEGSGRAEFETSEMISLQAGEAGLARRREDLFTRSLSPGLDLLQVHSPKTLFSASGSTCASPTPPPPPSPPPPPPRAALWLVALEVEQVEEQVTWPRNNRHSSTEASESLWLPKHVLMGKMFSKRKQEDLQRSHVSETIASYKSIIATHLTSEVKSLLRRSPWWFGDNTTSGIISFKMFVPPPSCLISSNLKL